MPSGRGSSAPFGEAAPQGQAGRTSLVDITLLLAARRQVEVIDRQSCSRYSEREMLGGDWL